MSSSKDKIVFEGRVVDLPEYLRWYAIPIPAAFFKALFKQYSKDGKPYFVDDAYALDVGDVVYSHKDAYAKNWGEFLKLDGFVVQIHSVTGKGNPGDSLMVGIYKPNKKRDRVKKERSADTTQEDFLRFLRTGDLTLL